MSYDVDRDEVTEAVSRGDVDWLMAAFEHAYSQRTKTEPCAWCGFNEAAIPASIIEKLREVKKNKS